MRTLIHNARIISPADGINEAGDILISDGKIEKVGRVEGYTADKKLDADNLLAMPGLVDIACHLLRTKYDYKEAIASEAQAVISAGVTTVCCMPDLQAVISSPSTIRLMQQESGSAASPRLWIIGPLTRNLEGEALSEMLALKQAGCLAVTNHLNPFADTAILKRALEYAAGLDLLVMLYPLDYALSKDGCMHEGIVSTKLGLTGIPVSAETAALGQYLALAEDTGAKIHFCRLSCARSVEMLAQARRAGLEVTADVSINHLFLVADDILDFNPNYHVLPPFRSREDRDALREGVREGVIDLICSDHRPHEKNAKLAPFPSTEPGISSIETLLPLALEFAEQTQTPLERVAASMTCSAARILGIEAGRLSEGTPADICLVDPRQEWTLDESTTLSSGKNTVCSGKILRGKVKQVFINGESAYEDRD